MPCFSFDTAKRVVIKIGSALLVDPVTGSLRTDWLQSLCDDIAVLKGRGIDVIVVSSGAVGAGKSTLNITQSLSLSEKQAVAAVGQITLVSLYRQYLQQVGINTAQILLTPDDTENRRRSLNARTTLQRLLDLGIVPIINENDTVATSELRYGDNDRLAARVASLVWADTLILLTDVDGLYTANPKTDPTAQHLPHVQTITPAIKNRAGDANASHNLSTGGMKTKIIAAEMAQSSGCQTVIACGTVHNPVGALIQGANHTLIASGTTARNAYKSWIASTLTCAGTLTIDNGAARALHRGKSLLPAGVTTIVGTFTKGDAVKVCTADGTEIARGLINYNTTDSEKIRGQNSKHIATILGYHGEDEIIHRNNMVVYPEQNHKTVYNGTTDNDS